MGWPDPPRGHAIEVRLYAEDPAADYQPQSGLLTTFEIPLEDGIRVDAGFESGSEVSTHYDAMLAKVIAHAPTRGGRGAQARRRAVAGEDPRRWSPTATCSSPSCGTRRFLAGDVSHRLPRTTSTSTSRATSTAGQRGGGGGDRAGRAAPASAAPSSGASRSPGATWCRSRSAPSSRRRPVEWFGGRDGYVRRRPQRSSPRARPSVTLETDGVRTTYDVAVVGDAVDVDRPARARRA